MLAALLASVLFSSVVNSPALADDFTFVQISDTHVEVRFAGDPEPKTQRGEETFRWMAEELKKRQHIGTREFAVPEFVVSTGDITEFGAPGVTWNDVQKLYGWLRCEWWPVLGNHDNTWNPITKPYTELLATKKISRQNKLSYSFDRHGCHFVVLNSATLNEPMPTIDVSDLKWLRTDLDFAGPMTPVFVFLHHPPDSTEFAQPYTSRALFEVLDGSNIALIAYGHGHAVEHHQVFGIDCVQGGSTFASKGADNRGYNTIAIQDGMLRVAYRSFDDAKPEQVLVEKPLVPKRILGVLEARAAFFTVGADGSDTELSADFAEHFFEDLGADTSRLNLIVDGALIHEGEWSDVSAQYRERKLGTPPNSRSSTDGARFWRWQGSVGQLSPGLHLVTIEVRLPDGSLRQASQTVTLRSAVVEQSPVPPVAITSDFDRKLVVGPMRYEGDANGRMSAFEGSEQAAKWTFDTTGHAIETAPVIAGNLLVFGAWDGFVYALDKDTGNCAWRQLSPKASEMNGSRYYSAADCSPVVIGDRIFVCDRGYELAWYSLTGEMHKLPFENVAAIGLSEDREHLNLRGKDDVLTRIDREGNVVWTTKVALGRFPCAPSESEGLIVVCSDRGLLSWIDASDGHIHAQWQATPGSYVMSPVKAFVNHNVHLPIEPTWTSSGSTLAQKSKPQLAPEGKTQYVARVRATDGSDGYWAYTPE